MEQTKQNTMQTSLENYTVYDIYRRITELRELKKSLQASEEQYVFLDKDIYHAFDMDNKALPASRYGSRDVNLTFSTHKIGEDKQKADTEIIPGLEFQNLEVRTVKHKEVLLKNHDIEDLNTKDGKLRCTSIGTSIVATQPFGFNFLGGKLVAMLLTDESLRQHWKKTYGDELVGLTTTALYGVHSMYNGIPLWKTLGESAGKIALKPDDSVYKPWLDWMKDERADDYKRIMTPKEGVSGPPTGVKQTLINYMFGELGIVKSHYNHGFKRGVYFSSFYENGREFLRGEIEVDKLVMRPKFAQGSEYINKWWKRKAIKRYTKLHTENRLKPEILYYSDILGMTWDECKEKYLGEVGR